jgi:hypothetical protein
MRISSIGAGSEVDSVREVSDPVSWLQIEQGWNVVSSDGLLVGTVAQVEGDKQHDIFDGLAVESEHAGQLRGHAGQLRYLPAEQVGLIYPGQVTLKISAGDAGTLEPFQAPPLETKWTAGKPPLATRISRWLAGKR